MGIRLIRQATLYAFPIIGDNQAARLTLLEMCSWAVDTHEPPWYGMGWEPLAWAIGGSTKPTTAQSQVSRQLRFLQVLRLIERSYENHDGSPRPSKMPARWILRTDLWITDTSACGKPHP